MILLLLIVLAFVIPKYIRDLRTAQKKASAYSTKIVNTYDTSIEYFRSGKGQPILVSHGLTGGFDQGLGLSKLYIGGEYDIISVSRFGYLSSTFPKDSTPDAQADAYKNLLDEIILGGFPINKRTNGVINDMYLSNPDINHNYAFDQIKVPVLIISAKDDPLCLYEGAQTLNETIPNAKLVSYEKGGHLILDHEKEKQRKRSSK